MGILQKSLGLVNRSPQKLIPTRIFRGLTSASIPPEPDNTTQPHKKRKGLSKSSEQDWQGIWKAAAMASGSILPGSTKQTHEAPKGLSKSATKKWNKVVKHAEEHTRIRMLTSDPIPNHVRDLSKYRRALELRILHNPNSVSPPRRWPSRMTDLTSGGGSPPESFSTDDQQILQPRSELPSIPR